MEIPVAMWKEAQMNLFTLCRYWGAAERGWGRQEHATSPIPFESSTPNTGDCVRDGKARGTEARETPTKRQGPHEESDGA